MAYDLATNSTTYDYMARALINDLAVERNHDAFQNGSDLVLISLIAEALENVAEKWLAAQAARTTVQPRRSVPRD